MTQESSDLGGEHDCEQCKATNQELVELRAQLARLRLDYEALLKTSIDRDYERPPHYL